MIVCCDSCGRDMTVQAGRSGTAYCSKCAGHSYHLSDATDRTQRSPLALFHKIHEDNYSESSGPLLLIGKTQVHILCADLRGKAVEDNRTVEPWGRQSGRKPFFKELERGLHK